MLCLLICTLFSPFFANYFLLFHINCKLVSSSLLAPLLLSCAFPKKTKKPFDFTLSLFYFLYSDLERAEMATESPRAELASTIGQYHRPMRELFHVYVQFIASQLIDACFVDSLDESDGKCFFVQQQTQLT